MNNLFVNVCVKESKLQSTEFLTGVNGGVTPFHERPLGLFLTVDERPLVTKTEILI